MTRTSGNTQIETGPHLDNIFPAEKQRCQDEGPIRRRHDGLPGSGRDTWAPVRGPGHWAGAAWAPSVDATARLEVNRYEVDVAQVPRETMGDHGNHLPSGNSTKSYGKSPFLMGKSTINGHFQ